MQKDCAWTPIKGVNLDARCGGGNEDLIKRTCPGSFFFVLFFVFIGWLEKEKQE